MTEEQLPLHKMSDEEIHDLAHDLANAVLDLRSMEDDFSAVKKEWSEQIKSLKLKINETSRILKEQEAARRSNV